MTPKTSWTVDELNQADASLILVQASQGRVHAGEH